MPTAPMWPLCSPPRRLPAPRISRSRAAMRKPAPRSENSRRAARRFRACSESTRSSGTSEIAVGELVAPPHPAAELVELREAEAVGAVDDHGVDVRDVDAVLDDRRRQQHVEVAAGEGVHAPRQLLLVELAVADGDPHAGDDLAQLGSADPRSTRPGCRRSRPARRAPARTRSPRAPGRRCKGRIAVSTAMRSRGGVSITDRSRTPASESWSVRGTGVADMASTWTFFFSCFSRSFWATPKRCSSSTIIRPSLGSWMSFDSSRWVPIRMSTLPSATAS